MFFLSLSSMFVHDIQKTGLFSGISGRSYKRCSASLNKNVLEHILVHYMIYNVGGACTPGWVSITENKVRKFAEKLHCLDVTKGEKKV